MATPATEHMTSERENRLKAAFERRWPAYQTERVIHSGDYTVAVVMRTDTGERHTAMIFWQPRRAKGKSNAA